MGLINKESFIEKVKENPWNWFSKELILSILEDQPEVDAEEVVRCKDCESYNARSHKCSSIYLEGYTLINGYCFNGKRKDK